MAKGDEIMPDVGLKSVCEQLHLTKRIIDDMTLVITLARLIKPFELKGDIEAAMLVTAIRGKTFTPSGMKARVQRSLYKEDIHFRVTGGKMRLWNREAIIAQEIQFMKDDGYEVI